MKILIAAGLPEPNGNLLARIWPGGLRPIFNRQFGFKIMSLEFAAEIKSVCSLMRRCRDAGERRYLLRPPPEILKLQMMWRVSFGWLVFRQGVLFLARAAPYRFFCSSQAAHFSGFPEGSASVAFAWLALACAPAGAFHAPLELSHVNMLESVEDSTALLCPSLSSAVCAAVSSPA